MHLNWITYIKWVIFFFSEIVVAESVVVIKKLLQMQPAQHGEIIKHMAKLLDSITVSTNWEIFAEFCSVNFSFVKRNGHPKV